MNQREYCEAEGIPSKAFGNWRAKFKAVPEPPARKLLYRRGRVSHTLSHSLSHTSSRTLSHVTYPSSDAASELIVSPPRPGHRRRFSNDIIAEAAKPVASVSKVARRYGVVRRVLCRWRQEQSVRFVEVEIVDEQPDGGPDTNEGDGP